MHFLAGHGAQIDHKPELVVGAELLKSHELGLVFFFHEEAADLRPNVFAFDVVVVQHVGRAVDRDSDFLDVREDEFLRISSAPCIGLDEQEQDALHRPPLSVDYDVDLLVRVFFYRNDLLE